ncbi:MAG: hypothetical protein ABI865_08980 [Nitrosospira sp.]
MTRFKPRARIAPSKTLAELDQYSLRARRNQPVGKEEAPFYTKWYLLSWHQHIMNDAPSWKSRLYRTAIATFLRP